MQSVESYIRRADRTETGKKSENKYDEVVCLLKHPPLLGWREKNEALILSMTKDGYALFLEPCFSAPLIQDIRKTNNALLGPRENGLMSSQDTLLALKGRIDSKRSTETTCSERIVRTV